MKFFESLRFDDFFFNSSVMDPYGVLAILGFLVFLFYLIYNYLNATGNAGRGLRFSPQKIRSLDQLTLRIWQNINQLQNWNLFGMNLFISFSITKCFQNTVLRLVASLMCIFFLRDFFRICTQVLVFIGIVSHPKNSYKKWQKKISVL